MNNAIHGFPVANPAIAVNARKTAMTVPRIRTAVSSSFMAVPSETACKDYREFRGGR